MRGDEKGRGRSWGVPLASALALRCDAMRRDAMRCDAMPCDVREKKRES